MDLKNVLDANNKIRFLQIDLLKVVNFLQLASLAIYFFERDGDNFFAESVCFCAEDK